MTLQVLQVVLVRANGVDRALAEPDHAGPLRQLNTEGDLAGGVQHIVVGRPVRSLTSARDPHLPIRPGEDHFAGLPDHPHYDRAQKYLPKGAGAIMAFDIQPTSGDLREAGKKFIDGLQLFSHLANVGDAKSLVIHPASTTHQQLSDEELTMGGISAGTVRLSIGIESTDDLLWDLDQARSAV